MRRRGYRKCLHCGEWFDADRRVVRTQRYCGKPACRKASHAASQQRWLSKPENRDYFRGAEHVARVRAWRQTHPAQRRRAQGGLHDEYVAQADEIKAETAILNTEHVNVSVLQDVLAAQPVILIGLIAHLMGCVQQDELAAGSRRLLQLGQDILGGGHAADQTSAVPRAAAQPAAAIQLGRPPPGT